MKNVLLKVSRMIRTVWFLIGLFVLALICIELGSRFILFVYTHLRAPDPRAAMYKNMPRQMGPKILQDVKAITAPNNALWESYVYWRCKPFNGYYMHIDDQGLRRTVNFGRSKIKIFVFGASTLWGADVPDQETIPSQLSKDLHERNRDCAITNFGQLGYVSTQSLLTLLLELRKGNIPKLAVFYDGPNEILATLYNGRAGIPLNEENRVKEFNLTRDNSRMSLYLLRNLFPSTIRILSKVVSVHPDETTQGDTKLADDCVRNYVWNVKEVEQLGKRYGFETLFFWSPTVFTKNEKTPYENASTDILLKNKLPKAFILTVYNRVQNSPDLANDPRFHDFGDIFKNEKRTVFSDPVHLTALGNEEVASRMLPFVMKSLKRAYK